MQTLSIPRGTSFKFLVKVKDVTGAPYVLQSGDTLIFGIKHYVEHKNYDFVQTCTSSNFDNILQGYIFSISPEATESFAFDKYWYDVSLQKNSGEFYRIIPTSPIEIEKIVTSKQV